MRMKEKSQVDRKLTVDHFSKTDEQVDKALERNPLND